MMVPALRVSGGNPVDGLPPAGHTEPRWINMTMDPRRSVILVDFFMFLVITYIRSYWFVTFRILCEYWLWCSTKPWLTTGTSPHRNVQKIMEILKFQWFFSRKSFESRNEELKSSRWRKIREGIVNNVICSTSFRRKPGWQFTAGSTYQNSS